MARGGKARLVFAYLVLLVVAAKAGAHFRTADGVSLWYPPAALTGALLLLGGVRFVPLAVAARTAVVVALGLSKLPPEGVLIGSALSVLPYGAAALFLRRVVGFDPRLRRLRDVAWFIAVAVVAAPLVAAALAVGHLVLRGALPQARYATTAGTFSIGDAVAVVSLAPVLLQAGAYLAGRSGGRRRRGARRRFRASSRPARVEVALQAVTLVGAVALGVLDGRVAVGQLYLCLLPVIWVALRRSVVATAALVAGLNATLAVLVHHRVEAFGGVADVQTFLVALAATGLCVAAREAERRRGEEEREQLLEELGFANAQLSTRNVEVEYYAQAQRDFVAAASHELRTPLTSIMGYLELVADSPRLPEDSEEQRWLAVACRGGRRLETLVGDVLLVNQVDTGRLTLDVAPVAVADLLAPVVEAFDPVAATEHLDLLVRVDPDCPPVLADRGRVEQVLTNLIGNAVKFTLPGGTVRVFARRHPGGVAVDVVDTGMGIAPEELPYVFDRFFRSASSIKMAVPGTGLGLPIARSLAEAHGGTLTATSTPGVGSTFTLTLPAATAAATDPPSGVPAAVPASREVGVGAASSS